MTIYSPVGANQFNYSVQTLWEKLVPRLDLSRQSVSFMDSCQEVIEIITERLWFRRSDMLREDVSYSLSISDNEAFLPAEFLAIAAEPFVLDVNNHVTLLTNLHESKRYDYINETGAPKFYTLYNTTVTIYPTTAATTTLIIPCYLKPSPLVSMADLLPFNGVFNQLIGDSAVKISNVGLGLLADGTFVASLQEKIDKMINMRNKKTIYFRQTRSGSQHLFNNSNSSARYF